MHYAGHAFFDSLAPEKSGLRLSDGIFRGEDLPAIAPPRLVYLSACESGRVRRHEQEPVAAPSNGRSLAETFLRSGISTLVGTFFAVNDDAAREFAVLVYEQIASGHSIGRAVIAARTQLHSSRDPEWGNFLLYGDDEVTL